MTFDKMTLPAWRTFLAWFKSCMGLDETGRTTRQNRTLLKLWPSWIATYGLCFYYETPCPAFALSRVKYRLFLMPWPYWRRVMRVARDWRCCCALFVDALRAAVVPYARPRRWHSLLEQSAPPWQL